MDYTHYHERAISLAEGLVNSHLPDGTHKEIETPKDLDAHLRAYAFNPVKRVTRDDVAAVQVLRARLRAAFEAPDEQAAARALNEVIADAGVRPQIAIHDRSALHMHHVPDSAPEGRRIAAETALALARVLIEDGFDRFRVCGWETCADVFIDRSKNRSRRYCSPEVCGNRAAARAWRARQKT